MSRTSYAALSAALDQTETKQYKKVEKKKQGVSSVFIVKLT